MKKSLLVFILVIVQLFFLQPCYPQVGDLEQIKTLEQQVQNLAKQGHYKDAIPLTEKILSLEKEILGPESEDVSHTLFALGAFNYAIGSYNKAEALYNQALAIAEKSLGEEDPFVASIINNLGLLEYSVGNYEKAEPLIKKALKIKESSFGREHQDVAVLINNLAEVYRSNGNYKEAETLYKEAIDIYGKSLGPEHPEVATVFSNLAVLYNTLGELEKAETLYKKALEIRTKSLGEDHPAVAESLNNLALYYFTLGNYGDAESLYKKALEMHERVFGSMHPSVATITNNLGAVYYKRGEYAEAESLFKKALEIRERVLGSEHPSVAETRYCLAEVYKSLENFAAAEPLYKKALTIYENAWGPKHPDVAAILNSLGVLYADLGNYSEAFKFHSKALDIRKEIFGKEHPSVAQSLNNLAGVCRDIGKYDKAEDLNKLAAEIRKQCLGSNHPDYIQSLENLAGIYRLQGEVDEAESLLTTTVLPIKESILGPDNPGVATTLATIAVIYHQRGEYDQAKNYYERALKIKQKAFGPKHSEVAIILNNLADIRCGMGNYAKAESLYLESLKMFEDTLGPEHPEVARTAMSMAIFYCDYGDYERASFYSTKALTIIVKKFGTNHPDAGTIARIIGEIAKKTGNYKEAETWYERALDIQKNLLGPKHPEVGATLNGLAGLYSKTGKYGEAERLFKVALEISEKILGPDNIDLTIDCYNLASLYTRMEKIEEANLYFKKAANLYDRFIDRVMGFTSEGQKIDFLKRIKWYLYAHLSFLYEHQSRIKSASQDALNLWLKRKGMILESQKRFQEALIYSDDDDAVKTFQELSKVRGQLSRIVFTGPGKEAPEIYRKKISDLEAQKEQLEASLSKLSQAFALKQKIAQADCEKVAGSLPHHTVLIDFVKMEMINYQAKDYVSTWLPPHYVAFILHAGTGDKVGMIDLSAAEKIDKLVAKFKEEITNIRDLKGAGALEASRELYDLVFEPLKKELGDVREIFISPDGNLTLIPFEVLQGSDGKFLIENYTFNYLAAGRDVIGFGQTKGEAGKSLLLGDPDFDIGKDEKESTLRRLALSEVEEDGTAKRSSDMRGFHFSKLPGTREEVTAIHSLLGMEEAELYTGKEALEEVLRQKGTPDYLHLATHGFFLSDVEGGDLPVNANLLDPPGLFSPIMRGRNVRAENPLLRSGIALAGANNALKAGDDEKSDGIVTAEKILGLRLQGTKMVVLSACETGLGEIKCGEGVFGLRRAFTQAGTKSLVMSLWAVQDKETKELMVEFYKNIVSGKMNRCQALKEAVLKEMKVVEERYGYPNPYYWGGFVFLGEP